MYATTFAGMCSNTLVSCQGVMNLSWTALVLSVVATLPQLYQTVLSKSAGDFNEWSPAIAILSNCFIAAHGYNRKDYGILFLGVWFIFYNSVLLSYKLLSPSLTTK